MAKKTPEQATPEVPTTQLDDMIKKFINPDFIVKNGYKILIIVLVVAVAVSIVRYLGGKSGSDTRNANKSLGPAYVHFTNQNPDSAALYLTQYVKTVQSELAKSKGYLLMGKALFLQKKYEESLSAYNEVKGTDSKNALLTSGALHGVASCQIELRKYQDAANSLENFISRFMRRTPPSQSMDQVDLSPAVPNVLWKLALCYKQLDSKDKLKSTCEKLIAVYSDSKEANKARRLLITI